MKMRKFLILFLAMIASVGTVSAQETEDTLEPTKLGMWKKPAPTKIANVDTYIDACGAMYQEAMDIRKQYESIENLTLNVGEAMAIAENDGAVIKEKKAQYEALLERVKAQQTAFVKLPDMAEAAAKSIPLGLKAIAITKSITSTKDAVKLTIEENTSLVKAITKQITTLSTAPVVE